MRRKVRGILAVSAAVLLTGLLGGCQERAEETEPAGILEEAGGVQQGAEDSDSKGAADDARADAGEQEPPAAQGRFVEQELPLPQEVNWLYDGKVLADGTIRAVGYANENVGLWDSADGGQTWRQRANLGELLGKEKTYGMCAAVAPDGSMFCNLMERKAEGGTAYYNVKLTPELEASEVELAADGDICASLCYADKGELLVQFAGDNTLYLCDDSTGEVIRAYNENGGYVSFAAMAASYVLAPGEGKLQLFDRESGEVAADPVLSDFLEGDSNNFEISTSPGYPTLFASGKDGEIYVCTRRGLYRHSAGGSVMEQLADGNLNSLSKRSVVLSALQVTEDAILVFAREDTAAKLYRYAYDKNVSAAPDTELKVYALEENRGLSQIISDFNTKNPQYYVTLETGVTGNDAVTVSDALRTLNTEIMAGRGPDVLLLDGMPVAAYMERGLLADLKDIVAEIAEKDGIWENVATTFSGTDGALLAVPSRFKVPVLVGDPAALAQISDLASLAEYAEHTRAEDADTPQIVANFSYYWTLRAFYNAYSPALVAEDGTLKDEKVREFITQMKRVFDLNRYDEFTGAQQSAIFSTARMAEDYGYDRTGSLPCDMIACGRVKLGAANLTSGSYGLEELAAYKKLIGLDYCPSAISGKSVYLPADIVGISSQTAQMEGAKAFVRYLFSTEAQKVNNASGFPVNRAAFEAELDAPASASTTTTVKDADGEEREEFLDYLALDEEEQERFRTLAQSLDTPAATDAVIEELVIEQTGKCLTGECTPEEAVSAISQKMSLYLAE